MGVSAGKALVNIAFDPSDIARLEATARSTGTSVSRTLNTSASRGSKVAGALKGADSKIRALGRGALYSAPLVGLFAIGIKKAADEAINSQNAELRLTQAYSKTGATRKQAIADLAELQRRQFTVAVSDEDMADAQAKLTQATGNRALAMKGLNASLDLAAARNISLDSAQKAVGKALNGSTAGLARFGVILDANSSKTQVLTQLQERFGGAAEKQASGAAGAMKKLSLAFGELLEAAGKGLIPLLTQLGQWLSKTQNQKKVQEDLTAVAKASIAVFQKVAGAIEFMSENWGTITKVLYIATIPHRIVMNIVQKLIGFYPTVKSVAVSAANKIEAAWNIVKSVFNFVKSIIDKVVGAFGTARNAGTRAANGVKAAWSPVDTVIGAVKSVLDTLSGLFHTVLGAGKAAARGISGAFAGAAGWFGGAISAVNAVIDTLRSAYDLATSIIGLGGHGAKPSSNVQGTGRYGATVNPHGAATGGTMMRGGWALVGERGPELVNFPGGSTVYDSKQTAGALGASGAPVVNVYVGNEPVDARVEYALNGVSRMVRSGTLRPA